MKDINEGKYPYSNITAQERLEHYEKNQIELYNWKNI